MLLFKSELFLMIWTLQICAAQLFGDVDIEDPEKDVPQSLHNPVKTGAIETAIAAISNFFKQNTTKLESVHEGVDQTVCRQKRDISSILSPVASSFSSLVQTAAYLPGVVEVFVSGVAGLVELLGKGIVVLASGVGIGASAIDTFGKSMQTLSTSVPTVVAGAVIIGGAVMLFYPGIQEYVFSAIASTTLSLAGRVAAGARSYVQEDSFWSTLLQTLEVFTKRARQDIS